MSVPVTAREAMIPARKYSLEPRINSQSSLPVPASRRIALSLGDFFVFLFISTPNIFL